ncbi:RcnB family protein [Parasphingorhabdus sp.]|uniref:RcnB family protein n=1 Tax=Parasphingorhabdus sp. TaxID=2709688 RepID=UPI003A9491F0
MKKFLMALAVTTMAVSPVVTAQAEAAPHQSSKKTTTHKTVQKTTASKQGKRTVTRTVTQQKAAPARYTRTSVTVKQNHRNWSKGQKFDRRYATNYRVIDNPRAYRLSNAPRGYQWVRSGNDAVLIAVTSGIIGAVIGNAIAR